MKKVFLLFVFFLFTATFCISAEWLQVGSKSYVDLQSLKTERQYAYGWFKDLNPGDWANIKKVKVHYDMTYFVADCNNNRLNMLSSTTYGVNGSVLAGYDYDITANPDYFGDWFAVVPDSVGERKYKVLCYFLDAVNNPQPQSAQ